MDLSILETQKILNDAGYLDCWQRGQGPKGGLTVSCVMGEIPNEARD